MHAGELKISCVYCHTGADESRHAGIPSANICMNCHRHVTASWKETRRAREGRPQRVGATGLVRPVSSELKKLYDAVGYDPLRSTYDPQRQRIPRIEWIKVHDLPDFVYFDHRRHTNAGVECQRCHGPVETMDRIYQANEFTMGLCVNCHRDVNRGEIAELYGRSPSTDCAVCHY